MTATNLFIVPTLGVTRARLNIFGLEDAYIKDEVKGIDYERGVYLLFRPKDSLKFAEFLEEERRTGAVIIDEYDYKDGYVMVVYQYPKKWQDDVEIIMAGKFSQVSEEFKYVIPRSTEKQTSVVKETQVATQHRIYEKQQEVKDYWEHKYNLEFDSEDEVMSFYLEREIFNQEALNKLI